MTQVELSRVSGVPRGTIAQIEIGANYSISYPVAKKLASVFDVKPETIQREYAAWRVKLIKKEREEWEERKP